MKPLTCTFLASLFVLAVAPSSHAASPTETAQHWFEHVVGGGEATLTDGATVAYLVESGHPDCKGMKSGSAKTDKDLAKVTKCVRGTYKAVPTSGKLEPSEDGWRVVQLEDLVQADDNDGHVAKIKGTFKDRQIVSASFEGEGETFFIYLGVDKKNAICGLWVVIMSVE